MTLRSRESIALIRNTSFLNISDVINRFLCASALETHVSLNIRLRLACVGHISSVTGAHRANFRYHTLLSIHDSIQFYSYHFANDYSLFVYTENLMKAQYEGFSE